MKNHGDLISILKSNHLRITPTRRVLIQYILNNKERRIPLKEIYKYVSSKLVGVDRSSIYRNLEVLKKLDVIQELNLPKVGKCFQYIFDCQVHHFYICKSCGRSHRGNEELFNRIEQALREVHGFTKANLSVVFYGRCSSCSKQERTAHR